MKDQDKAQFKFLKHHLTLPQYNYVLERIDAMVDRERAVFAHPEFYDNDKNDNNMENKNINSLEERIKGLETDLQGIRDSFDRKEPDALFNALGRLVGNDAKRVQDHWDGLTSDEQQNQLKEDARLWEALNKQ